VHIFLPHPPHAKNDLGGLESYLDVPEKVAVSDVVELV